jgi:uncharacterized protein YdiU (UPF0061 family)
MAVHLPFENTYARLPDRFYARVAPTPVRAPRLVRLNTGLAVDLGLDPEWLAGHQGLEVLAGQRVPDAAEPIASPAPLYRFTVLVMPAISNSPNGRCLTTLTSQH